MTTRKHCEVLQLARLLVDMRWEPMGNGSWVEGDPTGWRRTFDVSSAVVYAAHFLRIEDSVRHDIMRRLEALTEQQRPYDPQTKQLKPLHWWNAQQKGVGPVLDLLDAAMRSIVKEVLNGAV